MGVLINCIQAQTFKKFDTVFLSGEYNDFFQQYPAIRAINIDAERKEFISLTLDKQGKAASHYFDIGFEGDKYLLRKEYGEIPLPTALLEQLSSRVCKQNWYVSFRVVTDTIFGHLRYYCPGDSQDWDWHFEPVRNRISYPGGIKELEPLVQEALRNAVFHDSIYLLRAIVSPDKTINHFEVLEGSDKMVTDSIIAVLEKTGPWRPAMQGGRPVKAYLKLFIRVLPDQRIRLYVQNL
ncbi:hypothetical protein [Pseudoflavitalea rhizosphaerae]|uniref:hypothetical protein n=1 Tax=Pseudoflavitalea rhizosphaerae TaxID=1884793 RepID=UPI000F8C3AB0|nr:hypothetical protein [Pseudoflavitalea rhizosphaerae]